MELVKTKKTSLPGKYQMACVSTDNMLTDISGLVRWASRNCEDMRIRKGRGHIFLAFTTKDSLDKFKRWLKRN